MKQRVYIETTIISYLTARPSRDVVVAGQQQITRDWWRDAQVRFELAVSQFVINEASAGDPSAAAERLAMLTSLTLLEATEDAVALAERLVATKSVPQKAAQDAAHIAVAVTNGIDFLVTWNCKHIANAVMRSKIDEVCRSAGFEPTIICTPSELVEPNDELQA